MLKAGIRATYPLCRFNIVPIGLIWFSRASQVGPSENVVSCSDQRGKRAGLFGSTQCGISVIIENDNIKPKMRKKHG